MMRKGVAALGAIAAVVASMLGCASLFPEPYPCPQTEEGHAACAARHGDYWFCATSGRCEQASGCKAMDCCMPGRQGDAWCEHSCSVPSKCVDGFCEPGPCNFEPGLLGLTGDALGPDAYFSLKEDAELEVSYIEALRQVRAEANTYSWVWRQDDNPFVRFRDALEHQKMNEDLVRVLAYVAAVPESEVTSECHLVLDSDKNSSCACGPAHLTRRQAEHLGFDIDFRQGACSMPKKSHVKGVEALFDVDLLAAGLERELGNKAVRMPSIRDPHGIAVRLVKLFAADFESGFGDLKFDTRLSPSDLLRVPSTNDSQRRFVLHNVALVMARAALVPCIDENGRRAEAQSFTHTTLSEAVCATLLSQSEDSVGN